MTLTSIPLKGKVKTISPLVSTLLLTMIVLAGFTLLYIVWQSYASKITEVQKREAIKVQKELSWSANIEYAYILNISNTCTLHLWYYCIPINCNLSTLYLDNQPLNISFKNTSVHIIDNLYLYALTTNLTTCPQEHVVAIKLIIAFSERGSPYYITKETTYLAPIITRWNSLQIVESQKSTLLILLEAIF